MISSHKLRHIQQSTNSSSSKYNTLSEICGRSTQLNPQVVMSKLSKYRTCKVNGQLKIYKKQKRTNDYIQNLLFSFLGLESVGNNGALQGSECRCYCTRTQDNLCQNIVNWVEEQYYWKTDPQFTKILHHYSRKKLQQYNQTIICRKLKKIIGILGIQLSQQWINQIVQLLANYCKHAQYYQKFHKTVAESDVYIWVCIGIMYHVGFEGEFNSCKKSIVFWALDIAMDRFQDLTYSNMVKIHMKTMRMFESYYRKWGKYLQEKGVNIGAIIWQWLNEMMFGYMGIQNIVFFVDCFRKVGWNYLHKIILSYFQQKQDQIKKNQKFINESITSEQLHKIIIDGKQQWPMIFCLSSTFADIE